MPMVDAMKTLLRTCVLAVAAAAALLPGTGCETIGQDIDQFAEEFIPPSPREAAVMAFDQDDPDRRRRGTVLLSNSPFGGTARYLAMYRDMVANERDPLVKAAAILALGRHGDPTDALPIAEFLEDDNADPQVRWAAAKALQRLHNPGAVDALMHPTWDESEPQELRVDAAVALGQYPEDRVFRRLIGALDHRELAVNLAAHGSLRTLTGHDFGLDSVAWLTWYEKAVDPFAGQEEYLYPTYQRDETFLEKLAFWSSKSFEQPGPPAGLSPEGERATYQDDNGATSDETDG